jgi:hypothetical protein
MSTRARHNTDYFERAIHTVHPVGGPVVKGLVEQREELPHGGGDAVAVEGEVGHDLEGLLHELHRVVAEQSNQKRHEHRLELQVQIRALGDAVCARQQHRVSL